MLNKVEHRYIFFRKIGLFLLFFLWFIFLACVSGFLLVFHGPFTALKELYVTTAMTTYTHQYLAHWFVNDEEIERIMAKNTIPEPVENTKEEQISVTPFVLEPRPEIEYFDIKASTYRGYLLKVANPERITLVATDNLGATGLKVEEFAKKNEAVAAINAGGFADPNGTGRGGTPTGILIANKKIVYKDSLSEYSLIGFNKDNVLVLGKYTLQQIETMGIRDAVNFGPFLVVNGKPMITYGDGGWGIAPRTAIGQTKDGSVLLLVIDGRQINSVGATLKDVQNIMLEYGAENAANLDGGSSSTMYYKDKVINKPSSEYGPRDVPSAFIVRIEENLVERKRLLMSERRMQEMDL